MARTYRIDETQGVVGNLDLVISQVAKAVETPFTVLEMRLYVFRDTKNQAWVLDLGNGQMVVYALPTETVYLKSAAWVEQKMLKAVRADGTPIRPEASIGRLPVRFPKPSNRQGRQPRQRATEFVVAY